MKKINNKKRGFTIIETMISVALFLIVVTVSMSSLLNANAVHEKSRKMRSIMDSLNFAMEDMSRNLRTGYKYHCISSSIPGSETLPTFSTPLSGQTCWGIAFESDIGTSSPSDQVVYEIVQQTTNGVTTYFIRKSVDGGTTWVQLTPDEIVINPISSFSILGAEAPTIPGNCSSSDCQQPFVTIKLVGTINYKNVITPFSLQTSVSQRLIDV